MFDYSHTFADTLSKKPSRWLPYFMVMLGVGTAAAQETLLNYWFVYGDDESAALSRGESSRVLSVEGERGEFCRAIYNDVRKHPLVLKAWGDRQRMIRREVQELSRGYQAAGMAPMEAYVKAWQEVDRRYRFNKHTAGAPAVKKLLERLASEGGEQPLSDEEVQQVLQYLVADETRLELEEGRRLIELISRQRPQTSVNSEQQIAGVNDELMALFASALGHDIEGPQAFREAWFKLNRHRLVNHTLVGYRAPWGCGLGKQPHYRQAPQKVSTTVGSANTLSVSPQSGAESQPSVSLTIPQQESLQPDFTSGMNSSAGRLENFLATSPLLPEEGKQEDKEKDKETGLDEEDESFAVSAPPLPQQPMMMRSFSLRSAAAPVADTAPKSPQLTWAGSTGNDTWKVNGDSAATPWQGGAVYTDGSHVTFSSTTAVKDVQLDGTVRPGSITVSGTTPSPSDSKTLGYNYAFTGHGTIADYIGGSTSISVEGSATLVLNSANTFSGGIILGEGASLYAGCENATGSGTITMNNGSKLIVNYNSSDANYRSPALSNTVDVTGSVSISYGTASYDDSTLPSEWRNLSVTGGITGSGTLNLYGYTYSSKPTVFLSTTTEYNYVSNFSISEQQRSGNKENRFTGTVYLKNEYNHRANDFSEKSSDTSVLGGAVQLTLSDDVFANAIINLTRDTGNRTVGNSGDSYTENSMAAQAQTSDNILVLSGASRITLKGLEAQFLGSYWYYNLRDGLIGNYMETIYVSKNGSKPSNKFPGYSQDAERKLARVITDGQTTLVLDGADDNNLHIFSGSMGYSQSYTKSTESSILRSHCTIQKGIGLGSFSYYGNPSAVDACASQAGEGSLGVAGLTLEKNGSSAQYIHSAKLNTLSLQGGTLGFNNLDLSGYLNITSGTTLQLGVTGSTKTQIGESQVTVNTGWESISGTTSSQLNIADGKQLLVIAANDGGLSANVQGSITMVGGSDIMFSVLRPELSTSDTNALLNISGSLNLLSGTDINVNFSSVDFAKEAADKTYYLVTASSGITVDGKAANNFSQRFIPLGHGYYGILSTVNSPTTDYLVMNVSGDPRRTWSGNVGANAINKGVWTAAASDGIDYTWKENAVFMQGQVVLFGNLYKPVAWDEGLWGATSETTTVVDSEYPLSGITTKLSIDGIAMSGFQKVEIKGDVAPVSVTINPDYVLETDGETDGKVDGTNYYFCGDGYIRDAASGEIRLPNFSGDWKTNLRKSGTGTAVIATANTFSGGSVIEGGRLVMQNAKALGSGTITIQNGAILQSDFADDRSSGSWGSAYTGEGMDTTTIDNPVYVAIYVTEEGSISATEVDARLVTAHDKKLVLTKLSGGAETVLMLSGNSKQSGEYSYSVFKVLDPGAFYGTVKMDGNLHGFSESQDGGKVQMEIMSTAKATGGGNWLNAKVDLSVENGTERTVLALDALGSSVGAAQQIAQVDSLHGACSTVGRMNSSVLNMSEEKEILLEIIGANSGSYQGVLGFGDFQKTVDYDSSKTDIGMEKHSYGTADASAGVLSVRKQGNATQTVYSAWIKSLAVEGGGNFGVNEALVIQNLSMAGGTHLVVGNASFSYSHAVVVGAGGVLAFDAATGSDVFANIGPGIDAYTKENEDATDIVLVPPSSFVLLTNGSTISAHDDWKTTIDTFAYKGLDDESLSVEFVTDIAPGATVTVNTHNFTPDESIDGDNDVFGNYRSSHAIQLLGKMTGHDVHLMFNNELISAAAVKDGSARKRADGLGYEGATGTQMGYAAIRDIHQFTGDITVEGMTVLQVTNTNSSAASGSADMDITVQGTNAALQFTDTVTDQYINNLILEDGGQLLLGGTLKATTSGIDYVDETQTELKIQNLTAGQTVLDNLDLKKISSSKTISMGGTGANRTDVQNAKITTVDTAENYDKVALHHANLHNSVVQLHKDCSLDLSEAVLVDKDSAVQGASVQNAVISAAELQGPLFPTAAENKVTTSAATVVQLTLTNTGQTFTADGTKNKVLVLQMDQFQGVNVTGSGLTLQLTEQSAHFLDWGYYAGAQYVAIQVGGGSGQFCFEDNNNLFSSQIDSAFVLQDADGVQMTGIWVTATNVGSNVSTHLLYFNIPEPATTTLSLLALSALLVRRRRND